ncbi:TonB-dependent receptor [Carboxylicivirga sp. A043]|uniref:SusC/RagA family TonB-linked outer membrane protein n=1 Tax=Carboxylicivirga litoralis TaxID=2816963 RepID=UPI0021CB8DA9|nr:TonB-dependent receptor [Carboxylicivirga sp. A043]MCU4155869.1 TonB-dependent receptor [Carboxylicivirga sp. A043]
MKKTLFVITMLLVSTLLFAQQMLTVKGKVTDASNVGLPGVTVAIQGSAQGTITDIDGNYILQVSSDAVLVYSFIGFEKQEIPVNNQTDINVVLQESMKLVDEVVVVGYGEMKVKDLTSSITTVKSDDLAKTPSGQPMQALQGKVSGMQIVSSGAPGEAPTVRVRGIGSYPGIGDTNPLYVVDGMFFDDITFLNPSDIASISVLKDASAAAIYGVRAANGVILIETKSGSKNQKAIISYDGYYGTQVAQNVVKMANAEQFTAMAYESGSDPDVSYIENAMQRYGRSRVNPNVPDVNTDWYDAILRHGQVQNHSINVAGGGESATYSIGASYFEEQGILDMKNEFERFNLRSKLDYEANDWFTIGGNVLFSNSTRYAPDNSAWSRAYWAVPIMPVIDELNVDAWPTPYSDATVLGYRGPQNPFTSMDFSNDRTKNRKTLANFYAKIDILPSKLSFKTTYNASIESQLIRNVRLPYYITDNYRRDEEDASVTSRTNTYFNQIWDNVVTYTDSFGDHNLTVMLGSEYRDEAYDRLNAQGLGFPYQNEESWYVGQSSNIPVEQVYDEASRYYGLSYFGRISYNFKNRYLLYGTYRADGTSKYQEKWGYFPTVGAGWVLSEEGFMQDIDFLDYLKLRASWGQLGNNSVPASDGASTTDNVYLAIDDIYEYGTQTSSTFDYLKWEVTEETNFGVTTNWLNNRLSAEADYYIRDTKNAVIPIQVPFVGGSVRRNLGEIRNSGFELALNWSDKINSDLSYSVGFNMSTLKNEVRDLYGQEYIDGGSAEFRQRSIVGESILAFYGWETDGVYSSWDEVNNDPIAVANNLEPGDYKYKDQQAEGEEGYGVIDGEDRVVLGSYLPSFMYGGNLGLQYKNFEFSASFYGQTGNKILNRKRGQVIWTPDLNMDADLATNRTQISLDENNNVVDVVKVGKYPSSKGLRKGWNQKMSDYFVEDGAFFRIQNVQLAYNLKGQEWFGTAMPNMRISLTAERPLTVFNYNGFNPEVSNGVDLQTYPIPAVYTIGLNVKF